MSSISIIGAACEFPDASNPKQLLDNLLSGKRSFRQIPESRIGSGYFSEDHEDSDKIYTRFAGLIKRWRFDRERYKVGLSTFRVTDLTHWLALDVADRLLVDLDLDESVFSKERIGVIVGNTLTGEFSRANSLRQRWPFVEEVFNSAFLDAGISDVQRSHLLNSAESYFKANLPSADEESLAGSLSNTIAGRIANFFDFRGGAFTVDAACASSLVAIVQACELLRSGQVDLMIVGGVDISIDPFELVGFSRTEALAKETMRVFDQRSSGFWPGEGAGFVALARTEDASRLNGYELGRIAGWGMSTDGAGGITRPSVDGQVLAMQRAYQMAGWEASDISYIEAHGTGTTLGDQVELEAFEKFKTSSHPSPCYVGSIKAIVGHMKAASGIGGLINALNIVNSRRIPVIPGTTLPNLMFEATKTGLRLADRLGEWEGDVPLRAGVNGLGFGGINVHLAVEAGSALALSTSSTQKGVLPQLSVAVFASEDFDSLFEKIEEAKAAAAKLSIHEFSRWVSVNNNKQPTVSSERLAFVFETPGDFLRKADSAIAALKSNARVFEPAPGIFRGSGESKPRITFLFPGQGGNVATRQMVGLGLSSMPTENPELLDERSEVFQRVFTEQCRWGRKLLETYGIKASAAIGHSLGEISALEWYGVLNEQAADAIASLRGSCMDSFAERGKMAIIRSDFASISTFVSDFGLEVSGFNSRSQITVGGDAETIPAFVDSMRRRGFDADLLNVPFAFHTSRMERASDEFAARVKGVEFSKPSYGRKFISTSVLGREDGYGWNSYLSQQILNPVRFVDALQTADPETDLFIEVGPGKTLTGLCRESTQTPSIAVDLRDSSGQGILSVLAGAWAMGASVDFPNHPPEALRGLDDLDFDVNDFFRNPLAKTRCSSGSGEMLLENEQSKTIKEAHSNLAPSNTEIEAIGHTNKKWDRAVELIRGYLADRAELPVSAINQYDRFLSDLRLNSIMVAEIAGWAAKKLGVEQLLMPVSMADSNIVELVDALKSQPEIGASSKNAPQPLRPWLASFVESWEVTELAGTGLHALGERKAFGDAFVIEPSGSDPETNAFQVVIPAETSTRRLSELFGMIASKDPVSLIVYTEGKGLGLARTFAQEFPDCDVVIIRMPLCENIPEILAQEVRDRLCVNGFSEVKISSTGTILRRRISRIEIPQTQSHLKRGLVLVVGGAQGLGLLIAKALAGLGFSILIGGRSSEDSLKVKSALEDLGHLAPSSYISLDVTDESSVKRGLGDTLKSQKLLGVVYAAGINHQKPLSEITLEGLLPVLQTKVVGLRNLVDALSDFPPEWIISFGSVIGDVGFPAQGEYAEANDQLRAEVCSLSEKNPQTKFLNISWSAWDGVGMAETQGHDSVFKTLGIEKIPVDRGIEEFFKLLRSLQEEIFTKKHVIVSSRLGNPRTLTSFQNRQIPLLRFVENPLIFTPEAELISACKVDSYHDRYLNDHQLRGVSIFPAVAMMEAWAQLFEILTEQENKAFFNLKLISPLIIDSENSSTIEVNLLMTDSVSAQVSLRSGENSKVEFAKAKLSSCGDAEKYLPEDLKEDFEEIMALKILEEEKADDLIQQLYENRLFHGSFFQTVTEIRQLSSTRISARITSAPAAPFSQAHPQKLVLSSLGIRDAFIHVLQACVPDQRFLPQEVAEIYISGKVQTDCWVVARERYRSKTELNVDLAVMDSSGRCFEVWKGLKLRPIEEFDPKLEIPLRMLVPALERDFFDLVPDRHLVVGLTESNNRGATRHVVPIFGISPQSLTYSKEGAPKLENGEISTTHFSNCSLSIYSETPGTLGIDVEVVKAKKEADWELILGSNLFSLAKVLSFNLEERLDFSCTRVWVALEAAFKAGVSEYADIKLSERKHGKWVYLLVGELPVATSLRCVSGGIGWIGIGFCDRSTELLRS